MQEATALCTLCNQDMTDPRVLGCLHTFCFNCVSYHQRGATVHCPQCRYVTECEAAVLPKDLALDSMIKLQKGLKSCVNCSRSDAVVFCQDCGAPLCDSCSRTIHSNAVLRHHRIRNLHVAKQPTPMDYCPSHREEVSVFCVTCRRWICRECLTSVQHRGHEMLEQDRAADARLALQDRLEQHTQALSDVHSQAADGVRSIQVALAELGSSRDQCLQHVLTYMDALSAAIEQRRTFLLSSIQRRVEDKAKLLEQQLNALSDIERNMTSSLRFLDLMGQDRATLNSIGSVRYLLQMEAWAAKYTEYVLAQRVVPTPCVQPNVAVSLPPDVEETLNNLGELISVNPEKVFTYERVGDTKGIFYYFGSGRGCGMYNNPGLPGGAITVAASSLGYGNVESVVGHAFGDFCSQNEPSSWVTVSLPAGSRLALSHYTLVHDRFDTESHFLRHWVLEGWNETSNEYEVVDKRVDDTTLCPNVLHGVWAVSGTSGDGRLTRKYYQRFRLTMTDRNSHGNHYLMISNLELYGTLVEE
eukprot:PhM_4_TR8225/c0_g1_i1/m.5822